MRSTAGRQTNRSMDDPLLPPVDPPAPDPPPAPRAPKLRCEFCQCELTPTGDCLRMSDRAREYRDQTDTIDKQKATIAEKDAEIGRLTTDLAAARAAVATSKRGPY